MTQHIWDKRIEPTIEGRIIEHVLRGSGFELHNEYGTGFWFVVDVSGKKDRVLTGALPIKQAKKRAERETENRQVEANRKALESAADAVIETYDALAVALKTSDKIAAPVDAYREALDSLRAARKGGG